MSVQAPFYVVFFSFFVCFSTSYSREMWGALPESPYALILNLGMQAWGESRMIREEEPLVDDFFMYHDLVVGRLTRMQKCINKLVQFSGEQKILVSDISYLIDILTYMEEEQAAFDEKAFFKESLILGLIKNIKQQLIDLL